MWAIDKSTGGPVVAEMHDTTWWCDCGRGPGVWFDMGGGDGLCALCLLEYMTHHAASAALMTPTPGQRRKEG